MKFKLGGLALAVIVILLAAHFIFQRIPKPSYINRGGPIVCHQPPQFSDFTVPVHPGSIVNPVNFNNSRALAIKDAILAATASGINFAGDHVLVEGSCGKYCQMHAVLNSGGDVVAFGYQTTLGVLFKSDSRLLVLNPAQNATVSGAPRNATRYYEFTNEAFHYLCETN